MTIYKLVRVIKNCILTVIEQTVLVQQHSNNIMRLFMTLFFMSSEVQDQHIFHITDAKKGQTGGPDQSQTHLFICHQTNLKSWTLTLKVHTVVKNII